MKLRIYENDTLTSEIDHSPRQEAILKTDIEMRVQNGENVRYEVYEPPPNYTLAELKARKIAQIKAECTRRIYAAGATEHKQRNIGMGLITGYEAGQIIDIVVTHRDAVEMAEAVIMGAGHQEVVDNTEVAWP
jgi:hypothetical protein